MKVIIMSMFLLYLRFGYVCMKEEEGLHKSRGGTN